LFSLRQVQGDSELVPLPLSLPLPFVFSYVSSSLFPSLPSLRWGRIQGLFFFYVDCGICSARSAALTPNGRRLVVFLPPLSIFLLLRVSLPAPPRCRDGPGTQDQAVAALIPHTSPSLPTFSIFFPSYHPFPISVSPPSSLLSIPP